MFSCKIFQRSIKKPNSKQRTSIQDKPGNQNLPQVPEPPETTPTDEDNISYEFYDQNGLKPFQVAHPDERIQKIVKLIDGRFDGQALVIGNKRLEPLQFESNLEYKLHLFLRDPNKSQRIYDAFLKTVDGSDIAIILKERLAAWVVDRAIYMGSSSMFLVNSTNSLHISDLAVSDKEKLFQYARMLLKTISDQYDPKQKEKSNSKSVVILTTRSGGGHFSVAKSIDEYLLSKGFDSQLLIIDDFPETDPFFRLTGISTGSLFNEIHQKKGDIETFNDYMLFIHWYLHYYLKNTENNKFDSIIDEIDPVAIINTMGYTDAYISLSFHNHIPQLLVSTDYDIWESIDPVIRNSPDNLVKVGVPGLQDSIFKGILDRNQSNSMVSSIEEFKKSKGLVNSSGNVPIFLLGYPIRKEIYKMDDKEKETNGNKFNIKQGEKVVLVMMGSQGKASIFDVVKSLLSQSHEHIKSFIFTGRNEDLKTRLESLIKESNSPMSKNMTVLGFQSATEMNEMYNLADLIISKPGGATTAEVLGVELPIIMHDLNEAEIFNKEYLLNSGIGRFAELPSDIATHLNELLTTKPILKPEYKQIDWRKSIEKFISMASKQAELKNKNLSLSNRSEGSEISFVGSAIRSKESFKYGKFRFFGFFSEIPGTVSGLFLYPKNKVEGKDHFEIDLEIIGGRSPYLQTNNWTRGKSSEYMVPQNDRLFHTSREFIIEWTPKTVKLFREGVLVKTYLNTSNNPLHVYLNFWATFSGWPGNIVDSTWDFQQCYYIDKFEYTAWDDANQKFFDSPAIIDDFDNLDRWYVQSDYNISNTFFSDRLPEILNFNENGYLTLKLIRGRNASEISEVRCSDFVH